MYLNLTYRGEVYQLTEGDLAYWAEKEAAHGNGVVRSYFLGWLTTCRRLYVG